jgi:hypothetical protein
MDAARALLEAGAVVNDTISNGESALIVAIANGHWQLAALLLDKGADPNHSKAGWTPLHQLMRSRRLNVGFGFPPPIQTGTLDSIDLAKMLIAKGANVNARMTKDGMKDGQRNRLNRLGATPFLLASKDTDVEAMRLLLAAGADPSIPTADNDTPLMVAAGVHIWNPGEDGGSLATQEDDQLEAVKLCVQQGRVSAITAIIRNQSAENSRTFPRDSDRSPRLTGQDRILRASRAGIASVPCPRLAGASPRKSVREPHARARQARGPLPALLRRASLLLVAPVTK